MLSHTHPSEEPSSSSGLGVAHGLGSLSLSNSSSEDDFLSLPPSPAPEQAKDQIVESDFLLDDSSSSLCRKVDRRYFVAAVDSSKRHRSPDRFVPPREHTHSSSKPFRLSKSPQLLSPGEKLLRRRDHSLDPFINSNKVAQIGLSRRNTVPERRFSPRYLPHLVNDAVVTPEHGQSSRQISAGAVWNVGGPSAATGGPPTGIPDGHGGLLGSGTNAPMYLASFIAADTPLQDLERHKSRLALALDIDQATRVLNISSRDPHKDTSPSSPHYGKRSPFTWKDNTWMRAEGATQGPKPTSKPTQHPVPSTPFRVLDAPLLRDDFYCTALAYSYTARILAVGLSSRVYLWSELNGVQHPPFAAGEPTNHVTSLSFSSPQGGHSILAVGRQGGQLSLWSTFDSNVRFEVRQPNPVSCVSFKQSPTRRPSEHFRGNLVDTEDLAVGDDLGNVWYYAVEWVDDSKTRNSPGWNGAITLLAKISAHAQQICGLAWSPDGTYLATGGNDNACLLFELGDIFAQSELLQVSDLRNGSLSQDASLHSHRGFSRFTCHSHLSRIFDRYHRTNRASQNSSSRPVTPTAAAAAPLVSDAVSLISGSGRTALIPHNRQKHRLAHSAAVKAIAFAPWQPSLLATGGGSNDRCIHFYHTHSGSCLATINVHAQVTSLIWSRTRREIAATFGYAQPEHPIRIAVFSWPSCEQVVGIPWDLNGDGGRLDPEGGPTDCGRALWAISYPGGPNDSVMDSESLQPHVDLPSNPADLTLMPISRTATPEGVGPSTPARPIASSPTGSQSTTSPRGVEKEGGTWWSRTAEEGCIIVASSDETVKFHEVWSGARKSTVGGTGLLGGSDIIEGLEGIEKEGREVIR